MKKTNQLRRQIDPAGRVDWLASQLLERWIGQQPNAVFKTLYAQRKEQIDRLLARKLGPRNRNMRHVRTAVKAAAEILGMTMRRAA